MQKKPPFLHIYTEPGVCFDTVIGRCAMIFRSGKTPKTLVFEERKTPLQCLLDAIIMLTFFDAVVIAIATCSHRDSNMMLSTCVHVVINLATCCQVEVLSSGVNQLRGESVYLCSNCLYKGRVYKSAVATLFFCTDTELAMTATASSDLLLTFTP